MSVDETPKLSRDAEGVVVEFRCKCGEPHKIRVGYDVIRTIARERSPLFVVPHLPYKEGRR